MTLKLQSKTELGQQVHFSIFCVQDFFRYNKIWTLALGVMGLHKDVNIRAVIQTTQPYKFLVDYK